MPLTLGFPSQPQPLTVQYLLAPHPGLYLLIANPSEANKCLTSSGFYQPCLTTCTCLLQQKPGLGIPFSFPTTLSRGDNFLLPCVNWWDWLLLIPHRYLQLPFHSQWLWTTLIFPYVVCLLPTSWHFASFIKGFATQHISIFYTLIPAIILSDFSSSTMSHQFSGLQVPSLLSSQSFYIPVCIFLNH